MTGATHTAVGGAVGMFIPNPFLAFFAGVLSHFLIDKIPHFWPSTIKRQNLMIVVDGFLSASLLVLFFFTPIINKESILAGAFGGMLVDLILVIAPKFIKVFNKNLIRVWHEERQTHFQNFSWALVDGFMVIIALGVIYL